MEYGVILTSFTVLCHAKTAINFRLPFRNFVSFNLIEHRTTSNEGIASVALN